jgi:hypothetical protein
MVLAGGIFHDLSEWFFTLTPKISFSLASHRAHARRSAIFTSESMQNGQEAGAQKPNR